MFLSFGILAMVIGVPLLVLGIGRLAFSRPKGLHFAGVGAGLLCLGIVLVHSSEGGHFRTTIGLILMLTGFGLGILGCWIGFWGPIAARNATFGMKFILVGAAVTVLGIIVVAAPIDGSATGAAMGSDGDARQLWERWNDYRVGPFPFPAVALVAMVAVNGIALKKGLRGARLVGANLIMLACMALCYVLLIQSKPHM